MKSYRRLQKFIIGTIIFYVVIGYGFHYMNWVELFPIYSWELFSYVPAQERIDFGLRITSINGEVLEEPIYFENAEHLLSEAHSIIAQVSIQQFAVATARGETEEAARIREYMESLYLSEAESMTYQIVRRKADLLELWAGAGYEEEVIIATFEK